MPSTFNSTPGQVSHNRVTKLVRSLKCHLKLELVQYSIHDKQQSTLKTWFQKDRPMLQYNNIYWITDAHHIRLDATSGFRIGQI